jgi:hypothetical protein
MKYLQFLLVACLFAGTSYAASDPFVGKWKLNPSHSKLTDLMKVEAAGANRYSFSFSPGAVETIAADGSDQPGLQGTTLSATAEGPDTWKVVRKEKGRLLISAIWKLSADGKTLSDNFTGYQANGSTFTVLYVYKRTAGNSGFAGTWESVSEEVNSAFEIQIEPYAGGGLSFINPAQKSAKNMKFDGKDYPNLGPHVLPGSASSGHRVNERSLEMTNKIQGKIKDTQQIQLSPDLNTLTMTVHPAGQSRPNILVFDRE